ncbi:unnamed protein product [Amaranthus hypochondriacus]
MNNLEIDKMKKRLKEINIEAADLHEIQGKVEKEMGVDQGMLFFLLKLPNFSPRTAFFLRQWWFLLWVDMVYLIFRIRFSDDVEQYVLQFSLREY